MPPVGFEPKISAGERPIYDISSLRVNNLVIFPQQINVKEIWQRYECSVHTTANSNNGNIKKFHSSPTSGTGCLHNTLIPVRKLKKKQLKKNPVTKQ
jgi:hypothetical protein